MPPPRDMRIYEALVIPNEALDKGGLEILRAGLVDDELYVTARRVFKCTHDAGVSMPQNQRTPGAHEIEILVAIEIPDLTALGAANK